MTRFEKLIVFSSTATVGLSGVVYGIMKYLMTSTDPFSVVSHPLQPWMLDLHVLAAPLMIFAVGLIAREHIFGQMKKSGRRGRASGLVTLSCLMPLIATGYLIQVFTHETARSACVAVHLVTGAIYLGFFVTHLVIGRRTAALRNGKPSPADPAGTWPGAAPRSLKSPARETP